MTDSHIKRDGSVVRNAKKTRGQLLHRHRSVKKNRRFKKWSRIQTKTSHDTNTKAVCCLKKAGSLEGFAIQTGGEIQYVLRFERLF